MTPTESGTDSDLTLRRAEPDDLPILAEVYLRSRAAAERAGTMPPGVHSDAETRAWVCSWHLTGSDEGPDEGPARGREVWLAETGGAIVGFANTTRTFLDGLYVVPEAARRGVGTALLELVKAVRPGGFGLWVFEVNAPARALYTRHAFVEAERTDGADNEEHAPDVRMEWSGARAAPS